MKSLADFINESKKKLTIQDFGDLTKKFYVVRDRYYNNELNIVRNLDLKFMIRGVLDWQNKVEDSYWADMYEDFVPQDILYSTNSIKDAVDWVLKEKKISKEDALETLSHDNETCKNPDSYDDGYEFCMDHDLHDTDRFYWAVLNGYWGDNDVYPEREFKSDLKEDIMELDN